MLFFHHFWSFGYRFLHYTLRFVAKAFCISSWRSPFIHFMETNSLHLVFLQCSPYPYPCLPLFYLSCWLSVIFVSVKFHHLPLDPIR